MPERPGHALPAWARAVQPSGPITSIALIREDGGRKDLAASPAAGGR